jgi:hypothetical protein
MTCTVPATKKLYLLYMTRLKTKKTRLRKRNTKKNRKQFRGGAGTNPPEDSKTLFSRLIAGVDYPYEIRGLFDAYLVRVGLGSGKPLSTAVNNNIGMVSKKTLEVVESLSRHGHIIQGYATTFSRELMRRNQLTDEKSFAIPDLYNSIQMDNVQDSFYTKIDEKFRELQINTDDDLRFYVKLLVCLLMKLALSDHSPILNIDLEKVNLTQFRSQPQAKEVMGGIKDKLSACTPPEGTPPKKECVLETELKNDILDMLKYFPQVTLAAPVAPAVPASPAARVQGPGLGSRIATGIKSLFRTSTAAPNVETSKRRELSIDRGSKL